MGSPLTEFIQTTPITSPPCLRMGVVFLISAAPLDNAALEEIVVLKVTAVPALAVNVVHQKACVDVQTVDVAAAAVLEVAAQINKTNTHTYMHETFVKRKHLKINIEDT